MRKPKRSAVVALAMVGLLIAYPMSIGPALVFCNGCESAVAMDIFEVAYKPLQFLPEPLGHVLDEWSYFCGGVYGWAYNRFHGISPAWPCRPGS